jgi:Xaa-Pro aminopeptidase
MQNQKFINPNKLAEEALLELQLRITDVDLTDFEIENKENILKIFQVEGEPNWGERLIVVTKKKEILANVLSGQRDLLTLTKNEWNELLNPSPPNKLVYQYFRKLHNAFKTNAHTNENYDSAFSEILRYLKNMWEVNSTDQKAE